VTWSAQFRTSWFHHHGAARPFQPDQRAGGEARKIAAGRRPNPEHEMNRTLQRRAAATEITARQRDAVLSAIAALSFRRPPCR